MSNLRSLKDLKGKHEVVKDTYQGTITIEELEIQINEAKEGKAKVDKKYVGLGDGLNHLFDYKYNYIEFLSNIKYAIENEKKRKNSSDRYVSEHKVIIQ